MDPGAGCDLDPVSHWFSGSRRWVRFESSESLDPGAGCDLNPVSHWIQNLGAVLNPVSHWIQNLGAVLNPVTLLINFKYNYVYI